MRAAFYTLGCKVNQYETQIMTQQFAAYGYDIVDSGDHADVYVINSCTVTASGDKKTRQMIHRMKRENPGAVIAMTGCFPQAFPEEAQKLSEVDVLVGAGEKKKVLDYVNEYLQKGERIVRITPHTRDEGFEQMSAGSFLERTRAFVKIQDGCERYCAYCIIPFIRGKFRSRPEEAILAEAQDLAQAGMQELIVVAQDITRYGLDLYGARTLAKLLPKLCAIEGIHWVRLHYLYPDEITDELIDVIANEPKIVKYLDIPIQHISDHLLKSMHRRGTGEEIRALFRKLRERIPGLVLRTSLIAGFPGETEEDFEELCTFLREFRIQRAGVFPFSPEEGSAAATYPDQVDEDVKRRRVELITGLQMAVVDDWCESMMGQVVEVLCEGYDDETELYYGRSYADSPGIDGLVHFEGEEGGVRPGAFYQVKITSNYDGELIGILYEEDDEP